MDKRIGRVHSFQSLGTVDGPSLRSVVFMQGCPLRCVCCHNPDTWDFAGGEEYDADRLTEKILRYKSYYGDDGGVTVSGGEPLMQTEFLIEFFTNMKRYGITTCLDTSGCVLNDRTKVLLSLTDTVLLDYKYTNAEDYLRYTGCEMERAHAFLEYLQSIGKRTWIRYVVIPSLNDEKEKVAEIFALRERFSCIEKIELLPFRKLCLEKYHEMGIPFPLEDTPEEKQEYIDELYREFDNKK